MGNTGESNPPSYEYFNDYFFPSSELNDSVDYENDFCEKIDDNNIITYKSTDNTENKITLINKIFNIEKEQKEQNKKRAGRKRKRDYSTESKVEKFHSKYDYDNIIRKIQVHFQNFLISFINEILTYLRFEKKFLNIDYNKKKDIRKNTFEKLKSLEIGQILRQNISTKYRNQYNEDKEKNNKLYLEVIEYDRIRKILCESYINIFRNIYFINKRDLNDYGLNIILSNKVKTYQDLLESLNKEGENSKYIEKINYLVNECYFPKKRFTHN